MDYANIVLKPSKNLAKYKHGSSALRFKKFQQFYDYITVLENGKMFEVFKNQNNSFLCIAKHKNTV